MARVVLFLNRLRPGATREEYERFVREVDYPTAASIPSIRSYRVIRIEGGLEEDEPPFDYLEVVEVSDLDRYRRDLQDLAGREAFIAELGRHVGEATAVHGVELEA